MAISRDDQNTFIMIIGVMIVCIIALCAIFNTIWQTLREPVGSLVNSITWAIHLQTLDYNFDFPEIDGELPILPVDPGRPNPEFPSEIKSYPDAIYTIEEINDLTLNQKEIEQTNLAVRINSIGVATNLYQGEPSEEYLRQGFWVSPTQSELGEGEVVFFCNRRFFGPNDSKGCWDIDKIQVTDDIIIQYENTLLEYKVIGTNVFEANDPLIYAINPDEDLLKIITTHPLEGNTHRFVVLARRTR